jgi:hypothetical protein
MHAVEVKRSLISSINDIGDNNTSAWELWEVSSFKNWRVKIGEKLLVKKEILHSFKVDNFERALVIRKEYVSWFNCQIFVPVLELKKG